jgi:hypothetical protein
MRPVRTTALFPVLVTLLLAACGDDPQDPGTTPAPAPDGDTGGRPDPVRPTPDAEGGEDAADGEATDEDTEHADDAGDVADAAGEEEDAGPPVPVAWDTVWVAEGAGAVPGAWAGVGEVLPGGPVTVYPETGTEMPRNLTAPVFQWNGNEGAAYRLRFQVEGDPAAGGIEVYTTRWQWQPDPTQWDRLVALGAERTLLWQVGVLEADRAREGEAARLRVKLDAIEGAVYFWAPGQNGIVRLPAGESTTEPIVTGSVFNCVGCHALSPDGNRLAYTRSAGGTPIGSLGVISTGDDRRQIQPERLQGYYPSFAPDSIRMAVARNGNIVVIDTDTGEDVLTLPQPAGTSASQPAWSPARDQVVYAAGPGGGAAGGALGGLTVSNAGLVSTARTGTGWTDASWLVQPGELRGAGENFFYPAIDPTGEWVVFNRADAAAGAGSSPPGSEIWVTSLLPNRLPGAVFAARAQGPAGTTNSWPRWAPEAAGGRLWIAFTSNRPYGRIASSHSQIWIASIDPRAAARGEDPSAAAFWMPHQNTNTSNHVAYWTSYRKGDE